MNTATATNNNTLEALYSAGVHYGLAKSRRHPSTRDVIYGTKSRVDIFDLDKTQVLLDEACDFARTLGRERKHILFVGGKPESEKAVKEAAARADAPYCIGRWIGGTITNFSEIRKRIARMQDLEKKRESGELSKYTKFERLQIDREIEKLESMYAGLVGLQDKLPHALFVVDPKREHTAIREAKRHKIPVIALANTDCDIDEIEYPIPANDAARKSIVAIVDAVADAYRDGKRSAIDTTA